MKSVTLAMAVVSLTSSMAMAGEVLDRVVENGVLTIATDANWAPQSFVNENNEMDGFDVSVAREIAARLGVTAEFVTPDWDVITAGRWAGRWDISVGSMTPTTERSEIFDFPAIYYYTPAVAAVHESSAIVDPAELSGMVVGVNTASTFELYLQQDLVIDAKGAPDFDYVIESPEIRSYQAASGALDDLRLGDGVRISGTVDAQPTILGAIENGYPIKIVGAPLFYEPLAIAIEKGDAEFAVRLAEIVDEMREDGTLTTLSEQWYGVDYTTVGQ